jgi:hypothetical protein
VGAGWRAERVVRISGDAEPDLRVVALVVDAEKPGEARGASQHEHEEPAGQWIERARMADAPLAGHAPHARDDVVRGRPGGLVEEEDAVHRQIAGLQNCRIAGG